MAYDDLKVEINYKITDAGECEVTVGKVNNFADTINMTFTDESANVEIDSELNIRNYSTGKERIPLKISSPGAAVGGSLLDGEKWTIQFELVNTAGTQKLTFSHQTQTVPASGVIRGYLHISGTATKL